MAYTSEQKAAMYTAVSDKLTEIAVELRSYLDAEPELAEKTQASNEVQFSESMANQFTNYAGSFKVRAKQSETESATESDSE